MNNGIFVQDVYGKVGFDRNLPRPLFEGLPTLVPMPYHYPIGDWKIDFKTLVLVFDTSLQNNTTISVFMAGTPIFYEVDWGDGYIERISAANGIGLSHTYSAHGTYVVQVRNMFNGLAPNAPRLTNSIPLTRILSFGTVIGSADYNAAFQSCPNLIGVSTNFFPSTTNLFLIFNSSSRINDPNISLWNVSNVTSLRSAFQNCSLFNQPLGDWNTSNVTNMNALFNGATTFNNGGLENINNWNTSNVTDMSSAFTVARSFNQPLNNWDTSKVTTMSAMFQQANSFNQPLNNWNVSSVTNFTAMFNGATSFNQNISNWTLSLISPIVMGSMFQGATSFNQPIGSWNVSRVTNMGAMFRNANAFNQNLGTWDMVNVTSISEMFFQTTNFNNGGSNAINNWNTSNVTNMSSIFSGAPVFNQPLNNWNVRRVTTFASMFQGATSFNSSLSGWALGADTAGTSCASMFSGATNFNQDISNWDTSRVTNMNGMFSTANAFNQNIGGWNVSNVTNFAVMFWAFPVTLSFNSNLGNWNVSNGTTFREMFRGCISVSNQDLRNWNLARVNTADGLDNFMLGATGANSMTTANYDALLINWNNNKSVGVNGIANWRTDLRPNFGGAKYTAGGAAATARAALVSYGWTITDGGIA